MRVLIKERECTYNSDYPEGWKFSSGDYFKFPVNIKADLPSEAMYTCFIKRFEKKDPASITGWDLLVKLEHKNELNLTRVYDIASVEENGRRVYYVFYEFMKGSTLDNLIARNIPVDLAKLTNDLFHAFASLRKYGYWFADFVEKNIFAEDNGRYVLMDLDSAQPAAKLPHDDMYGSKDYWVLVFAFYKKILNYSDLKVADLSGLSLNHLQVIFLVMRLKVSFDARQQVYKHTETFNELPEVLDEIDPSFKELFARIYSERTQPAYAQQEDDIRNHIIQKIIPYEPKEEVQETPAIEAFTASPDIVGKGEPFELQWKVSNATSVELYKNGIFDTRFTPQEKGITKTAFYDGRTKTISYKLIALRGDEQVESIPVDVRFKEKNGQVFPIEKKVTPVKEPVQVKVVPAVIEPAQAEDKKTDIEVPYNPAKTPERKEVEKINHVMKAISAGVALLVLIGIIALIKWWPSPSTDAPAISSIDPRFDKIKPIIIHGKNFPSDPKSVQVFFNNIPAVIDSLTESTLFVAYPRDNDPSLLTRYVKVAVVIRKDTIHADLRVLKNLTGDPSLDIAVEDTAVAPDEADLTQNASANKDQANVPAEEKRKLQIEELRKTLEKRRQELERGKPRKQ